MIEARLLSDCLESLESGGRPQGGGTTNGDIPSIGGEHLNDSGTFNFQSTKFIPREYYERMSKGKIKTNDILVVKDGATTGKVSFVNGSFPFDDAAVNEHVFIVRTKPDVLHSQFAFFFLHSDLGKQLILKDFRGSAQGGITRGFVDRIHIPLPPLSIQKQIAAILEKADAAREKRRQANQLTEQFLQSTFLEMFGDPVTNPKGWMKISLGEMADKFSDGPFGSNLKTEHYTDNGIRVIRLQNIGVGELIDEDKTFISKGHFASISKHTCLPGDILIGTLGDPNLRACILPPSISIALNKADCIQLRPKKTICTSEFVCQLINQPETLSLATGMIHGQTRARINMGRLRDLVVPCPPLSLQQKFTALVEKVDSLRAKQRESEKELDNLFQSLMQRAFKGELVS